MKDFKFCETPTRFGADLFIDCKRAQTAINALFSKIVQSEGIAAADKDLLLEFKESFEEESNEEGFSITCEDYILELEEIESGFWYASISLSSGLR